MNDRSENPTEQQSCELRNWCDQPADHSTREEHSGLRRDVSATADPVDFEADPANGGVRVPSVSAFLTGADDPTSTLVGMAVGVNIYVPGTKSRDVDAYMTVK